MVLHRPVPARSPAALAADREPLDLGFLSLISSGIAATVSLWEPLADVTTVEVTGVLLLTSERYEVWLRCWPAGGRAAPTGATGATGATEAIGANVAFTVVRGALVRTDHDLPDERDPDLVRTHVVETGMTQTAGADRRLDLANLSREPAVSIHALSPPRHRAEADRGFDPARGDADLPEVVAGRRTAPRLPPSIMGYAAHPSRSRRIG
jgi:hypothetical protein